MQIATRTLKVRRPDGDVDVPVRIFAPEKDETTRLGGVGSRSPGLIVSPR
jgi:hypothetical protein